MSDRVVYTWRKNAHEEVRATVGTFKGKRVASLRVYYTPGREGRDRPISISTGWRCSK